MGFKIISDRDQQGNFIISSDQWNPEKISRLLDKYYPQRIKNRQKQTSEKEKTTE